MLPYYSTARPIMKGVKLNMARATKLPSGSYRCQASYTDDYGVLHRASFTEPNAKLAEAKAAMWRAGLIEKDAMRYHLPLGEAIDQYIETCRATGMSPATVRSYVASRKSAFSMLIDMRVDKITIMDVQRQINARAAVVSPKTIKNNIGLLSIVLKQNGIKLDMSSLRMPRGKKRKINVPTDSQVTAMLNELRERKDDDMFIAVTLASLYGLRRSEICALRWADISSTSDGKHVLNVNKAVVLDENGVHVEKDTKTEAGTRSIVLSDIVYQELASRRQLRPMLVALTPNAITERYNRLAKNFGADTSFHVLRHYMASVMAAKNVNPVYAAHLLGHASYETTRRVYTHAMSDELVVANGVLDEHAECVIFASHAIAHES